MITFEAIVRIKFVRSGIQVSVNDRLRIDVTVEPGTVQELVTVTAASPVIKTESSTISTLINDTQVAKMPLNGRNLMSLVIMQPGVSSGLGSTPFVGLGNLTSVSVNGNRASQNNWMVDGADNNDVGSNLALINYVNIDTVAEVNILRSNYTAEFGRSGGARRQPQLQRGDAAGARLPGGARARRLSSRTRTRRTAAG